MTTTRDRRHFSERRERHDPAEPLERQAQRRGEDRRISPRVLQPIRVVDGPGTDAWEINANLSMNGAYFTARTPRQSTVELRFRLPDLLDEVRIPGTVERADEAGVLVKFGEMELKQELALARCLDREQRRLDAAREH